MKMRKILGAILLAGSLMLVCAGCGTMGTPKGVITFDPALPEEETSLVTIEGTIYVREYNGIYVEEAWYPDGKWRVNDLTLPAGPTVFLFDISAYIRVGNTTTHLTAKDIELHYDFEAGKSYVIDVYTEGMGLQTMLLGKMKVGIAIWDSVTAPFGKKSNALKSWELGEI